MVKPAPFLFIVFYELMKFVNGGFFLGKRPYMKNLCTRVFFVLFKP